MTISLQDAESKFYDILNRTMGEAITYDNDSYVFLTLLSRLLAKDHILASSLPNLRDIDIIPDSLLPYLQAEYGMKLPEAGNINIRELLRESKAWYSGKGTIPALEFLAAITGTAIEMYEPSKLIQRSSTRRTVLSGSPSTVGKQPYEVSKLGRLRDKILWSYYTYILTVRGMQNLESINTFTTLLDLSHPAGTSRFINGEFVYHSDYLGYLLPGYTDVLLDTYLLEGINTGVGLFETEINFSETLVSYTTVSEALLMSGFGHLSLYGGSEFGEFTDIASTRLGEITSTTYSNISTSGLGLFHRFVNVVDPLMEIGGPFAGVDLTEITNSALVVFIWNPSTEKYTASCIATPMVSHVITGLNLKKLPYGASQDAPYSQIHDSKWNNSIFGSAKEEFMPYMYGTNIVIT